MDFKQLVMSEVDAKYQEMSKGTTAKPLAQTPTVSSNSTYERKRDDYYQRLNREKTEFNNAVNQIVKVRSARWKDEEQRRREKEALQIRIAGCKSRLLDVRKKPEKFFWLVIGTISGILEYLCIFMIATNVMGLFGEISVMSSRVFLGVLSASVLVAMISTIVVMSSDGYGFLAVLGFSLVWMAAPLKCGIPLITWLKEKNKSCKEIKAEIKRLEQELYERDRKLMRGQ